jgi:hypothetical protein
MYQMMGYGAAIFIPWFGDLLKDQASGNSLSDLPDNFLSDQPNRGWCTVNLPDRYILEHVWLTYLTVAQVRCYL